MQTKGESAAFRSEFLRACGILHLLSSITFCDDFKLNQGGLFSMTGADHYAVLFKGARYGLGQL